MKGLLRGAIKPILSPTSVMNLDVAGEVKDKKVVTIEEESKSPEASSPEKTDGDISSPEKSSPEPASSPD